MAAGSIALCDPFLASARALPSMPVLVPGGEGPQWTEPQLPVLPLSQAYKVPLSILPPIPKYGPSSMKAYLGLVLHGGGIAGGTLQVYDVKELLGVLLRNSM